MSNTDAIAREIADLFGYDYDALDQVKKHDLHQVLRDVVADPPVLDSEIADDYEKLETALSERGLDFAGGAADTWLGYLEALDKIAEHLGEGRLTHHEGDDRCPAMLLAKLLEAKLLELGNKIQGQLEEIQELEKEAREDVTGMVSETDMEEYREAMADLRATCDLLTEDLAKAHARREVLESELAETRVQLEDQAKPEPQWGQVIMSQLAVVDDLHVALQRAVQTFQTAPVLAPVSEPAFGVFRDAEIHATRKILCALDGETTDAAATKLIEALRKTEAERNTLRAELKARIQDAGAPADIARQITERETEIAKLRADLADTGRLLLDNGKTIRELTQQLNAVTIERDELARQVNTLVASPDTADLAPGHVSEATYYLESQIADLTAERDVLARQVNVLAESDYSAYVSAGRSSAIDLRLLAALRG